MKISILSKIVFVVGSLMASTGCGNPMMGIGTNDPTSMNATRLPIVYYAKDCNCPTGNNCGAVRGATSAIDNGSSLFACKNLPGGTTTTGTAQ